MLMMEAYEADFVLSGQEFKHESFTFDNKTWIMSTKRSPDLNAIIIGYGTCPPCPAGPAILQSVMLHWPEIYFIEISENHDLREQVAQLGFKATFNVDWIIESLDKKVRLQFRARPFQRGNTEFIRSFIIEFTKRVLVPLYRMV